jgi:hypothetical protein
MMLKTNCQRRDQLMIQFLSLGRENGAIELDAVASESYHLARFRQIGPLIQSTQSWFYATHEAMGNGVACGCDAKLM